MAKILAFPQQTNYKQDKESTMFSKLRELAAMCVTAVVGVIILVVLLALLLVP